MKEVNSEYTVKLYDYCMNHKYTYMILELCGDDLRKILANKRVTESECVSIFS
jgi:hypothetical protein